MVNDIAVQDFVNAIKEEPQDTNKTYNAVVSHIDNEGVVWVYLQGSSKETPTASTSTEVQKGDSVTVQWRNNKLYIGGNYSNPSAGVGTVMPSVDYVAELIDKDVTVNSINAATGYIKDLTAENITADDIQAGTGYIKELRADNITAEDIVADHGTIGSLDVNYAKINAANVTDLSAQNAWVNKIMVQTGLLAHEGTVFTLDAIQVNAANITAGTLDVNRLIVTVNGQKYLVNVDPTTGTPSYEKMDGNIVEPRTITADKIVAHDITVQEITTENLVGTNGWINLNQGKFFYGNGANYASSTNAIDWNGTTLKIKGDIGDSVIFNNYSTTTEMNTAIGNAVDGIEVGGRNLLLKTATPATGTMESDTNAQLNPYNMVKSYSELGLTTNDYVTVSFDYSYTNGKAGGTIKVGTNASPWEYFGTLITTTAGSNSGHIESSFKVTSALAASTGNNLRIRTDNCNGMTLTVSNAKLEKGNKATDWTPAPEDVQAEIDKKKSVRNLMSGSSGNTYTNILGYASASSTNFTIDNSASGFDTVSDVQIGDTVRIKYLATNMGSGGTYVYIIGEAIEIPDGTHVKIAGRGLDTTVIDGGHILTGTIDANSVNISNLTVGAMTSAAQDLILNSNIQIGGRNLLGATDNAFLPNGANSAASMTFGSIGRYNSPDSEFSKESYDGSSNSLIVTSTETGNRGVGWYTKKGEVKAGETYTFSCRVKANVATTVHTHTAWRNGSATAGYTGWTAGGNMSISANTWTDYSYTFTPSSSAQLSWEFYVALCFTGATTGVTCRIAHAMLEKGNKATDWSPASGDETGTNLISYPYFRDAWSGSPYTASGVTYTLNKDGTVTAKGTATANAWYSFSLSHYPNAPNGAFGLPAGTYTLSGCPSGGSSTTYRINFTAYSVDDGTTGLGISVADYGNGATVTLTQPALVRVEALISNGYACPSAGITFKPMLEVGGVAHAFASPTSSKAAAEGATNYLHADSNGLRIASADPRTQNQRIQMTSSNIDMYDSGGVKRININATSGVTVGRSDKGHTIVDDTGLSIFDTNNKKRSQVNASGLNVFDTDGSTSVASFGATARIGTASGARAVTTSTGLDIYNSSNQKKASYGSTQYIYGGSGTYPLVSVDGSNARLMQSANNYANVNSSGLQIYQNGASVAEFGSSARVGQTASNNIVINSDSFKVNDADGFTQFSITPSSSSTSRTSSASFGSISSGGTRYIEAFPKSTTSFTITVNPSSGSPTTSSLTIPATTSGASSQKTVGVATVTLTRMSANGPIRLTIQANSAIAGGRYTYAVPRRVANIMAGGYDLCYTAGDYIASYVWTGASFLTSSKTAIDVVLPINRPILAENVTVTNVTMTTRQGGNYTHGSSASSSANWTVSSAYITEGGVRLTATNSTTTNAINNDVIGIYLTCSMTFS